MTLTMRFYDHDRDFSDIRNFLLEIHQLTESFNYLTPLRVENNKYGTCGWDYTKEDDRAFTVWEVEEKKGKKMVAITFRGSKNDHYLEMHPMYRQHEKQIIQELEKQIKKENGNGDQQICFYASETDKEKITILQELNYTEVELWDYNRVFKGNISLTEIELPDGFIIRNIEGEKDYEALVEVVGSVMVHCRDTMTVEKVKFFCSAPFYKPDLDLVVVAPDGKFAAFCTFRMDPRLKMAELDPVGTRADYRKLGLAKAVISEGLRRVRGYETPFIYIPRANPEEGANKLYDSLGFTEKAGVYLWRKEL